jgi:hypothetical protein
VATGTGHATNLYVDRPKFECVRGEELTARFDLASVKSFATTNTLFAKSTATVVAFISDSSGLVDS